MGENEGILFNGLLGDNDQVSSVTRVLELERWSIAEQRTAQLISCIQPNPLSEAKRNAVAKYVQRLVMQCISCEVFTFGSVPLKTYLPDGDIDLTAFSHSESLKETWANEVRDALQNEEKNENAEFRVKDVQYIQAEVKLIKCLVENIIVDISFNQVGGLCTLCFLEEVDNYLNHNHLFKRSIILIKAWCYYESRILGAHHGLISTYALETLVLYIFNVFNNSFAGPLEVLYRFLEFFSNFDWDSFCVSLSGPVPINSLPDMTADPPRKDKANLLLQKGFLESCNAVYAVSQGRTENAGQPFISKHFNVIDPLRANNNLGRSVSKGNFYRIRSAFAFGAKRLARVLECPEENLIDEVNHFFKNTWERHGKGLRLDAPILKSIYLQRQSESVPVREFQSNSYPGTSNITDKIKNIGITTQSSHINHTSSESERVEKSVGSGWSIPHDVGKKIHDSSHRRIQLARTQSSPELTERQSRALGIGKPTNSNARIEPDERKINMASRNYILGVNDSSSHRCLDAPTDTKIELPSASKELEMQQDMQLKQQDFVNMMASRPHSIINGQTQFPMHLASTHLPFHGHKNSAGYFPNNIAFINSAWGSNMQFPQGFVTAPVSPFFTGALSPGSNLEEHARADMNSEDNDHHHDIEANNSIDNFVPFSQGLQRLNVDSTTSRARPNARIQLMSQSSSPHNISSSGSSRDVSSTNINDRHAKQSAHGDEDIVSIGDAQPDCELAQIMNVPESIIPMQPMVLNNYRHKGENNSGVVFYPTGPPVPYLTMLPLAMYNYQSGSSNTENSPEESHADNHETGEKPKINVSEMDILNSDFQSHYKNLQYGRLCQTSNNAFNYGPLGYSSQIMIPPGYMQGHVAWEGPGRPISNNHNFFSPVTNYGSRLVPGRNSGVFQRYGDVAPRFRGGTGTYLPNPASYRDKQFPNTRHHRGNNYNSDRNDHDDREGSWINTKTRANNRNHARNQTDKPFTRSDNRSGPADKRSDRPWNNNSYRHKGQNSYFTSTSHGSNVPYDVYSVSSNVNNANVMMMYPYDQGGACYASSSEGVEMGSHVPVQFSEVNENMRSREGRHGPQASPDHPSSPRPHREV